VPSVGKKGQAFLRGQHSPYLSNAPQRSWAARATTEAILPAGLDSTKSSVNSIMLAILS
jgi:hypothetical protein